MGYALTEEQQDLRATVRRFLEEKSPMTEVRRLMETDASGDARVWMQLTSELGLPGVAIPEDCGGFGFGFVELGLVMSELGRALACVPYLSSVVLGGGAIRHVARGAQRAELLGAIAAGETAALALDEPGAETLDQIGMQASPHGDGWQLDGCKLRVVDGHSAQRVLVVARLAGSRGRDGLGLFLVPGDAVGLARRVVKTLDPTRKLARLDFSGVPAVALGTPGEAGPALQHVLDEACVALACEMVGATELVLEMAVAYARDRVQFGRAIGSFQAVKHRCADILIGLEGARSLARFAALAVDGEDPELPLLAAAAKARCADVYQRSAVDNVQIHGGVGYTWEYDAHLYLRRAKASSLLLGDPRAQRSRLAGQLTPAV